MAELTRTGPAYGSGTLVWSSAPWRALAVAWMDEQLAAAGIKRTGEVEQPRVRPWGTVLVAPTTGGQVWFKAPAPATAFEVGLYALLHRVAPEHVLAPIAADVTRGWLMLPDGGPVLGEQVTGAQLTDALLMVLPQYAQLQRALDPHVDELLFLEVVDMRADIMPARFDQALEAVGRYVDQHGSGADRATYQRVTAMRATFATWCEQLAQAPGSPSIDHNDLHPWNIFAVGGTGAAGAKIYDWGDSVLAHPFSSMLVALRYLAKHLEVSQDHPDVVRVRDAYLAVFSDVAPHAELVTTMDLACTVGKVARSLVWERALGTVGPYEPGDEASAPLLWLDALCSS